MKSPEADIMSCARCGHALSMHGRRGYGHCRARTLSDHGRHTLLELDGRLREKAPVVRRRVLLTAAALPGMWTECECSRFRVTAPADKEVAS